MKKYHAHRHWLQTAGGGAESGEHPECLLCTEPSRALPTPKGPRPHALKQCEGIREQTCFGVCFFFFKLE